MLVARSADVDVVVNGACLGFLSFAAAAGANGAVAASANSATRTVSFGEIGMRKRWGMLSPREWAD
jgi:hypothetical protein